MKQANKIQLMILSTFQSMLLRALCTLCTSLTGLQENLMHLSCHHLLRSIISLNDSLAMLSSSSKPCLGGVTFACPSLHNNQRLPARWTRIYFLRHVLSIDSCIPRRELLIRIVHFFPKLILSR